MRTEKMIGDEIRERYAEIVGRDQAIIKMINNWPLPKDAKREAMSINVRELRRKSK